MIKRKRNLYKTKLGLHVYCDESSSLDDFQVSVFFAQMKLLVESLKS